MKITGVLVDMLVQLSPEMYGPFVVFKKGHKVLHVQVLKAIDGMLQASLLWYQLFRSDLEGIRFEFNLCNPCEANCKVKGLQHIVRFHVDDLKSSCKDPKVNDEFSVWLNEMYGGYGKVKAVHGKHHNYLGMNLDFTKKGK